MLVNLLVGFPCFHERIVEKNLGLRRYLFQCIGAVECGKSIVDNFQGMLAGLFDPSIDGFAHIAGFSFATLAVDLLANLRTS